MDCTKCINKYTNDYEKWCIYFQERPPKAKVRCSMQEQEGSNMWRKYRRKGLSEMRPHVEGEDLTGISVSEEDSLAGLSGGMIARNPNNHKDQWYVAKKWFEDNYEQHQEEEKV